MSDKRDRPPATSRQLAVGGWLVAGIPILVSSVQAAAHAIGVPVERWPVVGAVAAVVKSIPEFRQIGLAFNPDALSIALFLLTTGAWVVLGMTLFRPFPVFRDHSQWLRGAATFATTILYVLLYVSAHWQLLVSGGGPELMAVLLVIPAIVLLGIYIAYYAQPPTDGHRLLDDAEVELSSIESEFDRELQRLDKQWQMLHETVHEGVGVWSISDAGDVLAISSTRNRLDSYRDRIDKIRDKPESERARAARDLLDEVESLSASDLCQNVEEQLRSHLAEWLRLNCTPSAVRVQSKAPDGMRTYDIADQIGVIHSSVGDGAPQAFKELTLNGIDDIAQKIETGQGSFKHAVGVVDAVAKHVQDGKQAVSQAEKKFLDRYQDVDDSLTDAGQRLDQTGRTDAINGAVTDIYKHGRTQYDHGVTTLRELEERLEKAVDQHYQCDFETALKTLDEVEAGIEKLETVLNALQTIDQKADNLKQKTDSQSLSVPVSDLSAIDDDVFVRKIVDKDISGRLDHMSCELDSEEERVVFEYEDPEGRRPEKIIDPDPDEIDQDVLDEGIKTILRAIRDGRDAVSFDKNELKITVRKDELTKPYDSDTIIRTTANHIEEQSVLDVETNRDELDDGFEFTVNEDASEGLTRRQIGTRLLQSYEDEPIPTGGHS